MKKSAVTSEAWNQVLQRDLKKVSRDQNNFNEVSSPSLASPTLLH
jgi:hypothetical protein